MKKKTLDSIIAALKKADHFVLVTDTKDKVEVFYSTDLKSNIALVQIANDHLMNHWRTEYEMKTMDIDSFPKREELKN